MTEGAVEPEAPAGAVVFRPSRVDGVAAATEVRVDRRGLRVLTPDGPLAFAFAAIAPGREVDTGRAPVGTMRFSRAHYPDSCVAFYTTPPITVYMPADGPTRYPDSHFWRIQAVLRDGGFNLYDADPGPPPARFVLDPRPWRTVAYVAAILAAAWAFGLSGSLPDPAGAAARQVLLGNPVKPNIGLAFALPTMVVPILLAMRHGRSKPALAVLFALACALVFLSEWALRRAIGSWAPLESPPYNHAFWSARHLAVTTLIVAVGSLGGAGWRRGCLEPIPEAERRAATAAKAATAAAAGPVW